LGLGISDPKAENEYYHSMAEEFKSDSVTTRFGVDPDVLRLGLVSFLTDVSSEMIFSVFAIFFTTIAGASSALLGLVEGFADFSASSLDYVAGWWSDKIGRRKAFALVGYGFSTVAKISLLVASSVVGLSCFRIIERLGKSFRGPPRDAWLSAIAAKDTRGYSFGVQILLLFVIYGVFYSIDEAQSKAFIADVEPERRATAIGVYNFVTGVIYLPASLIAGALWAVHPSIVFIVAAFLSLAAITAFVWLRPAGNST
jgi:hypothetical protein